jgi:uncharacterized membrane protein YheB (UPF0754 family)
MSPLLDFCYPLPSFLCTTTTGNPNDFILYLLPPIAALIGWITNFLAVKMLFHPKLPIFILGFPIQGVFPKRQAQLAAKLGDLVSEELFSVKEVTDRIKEVSSNQETMELIGKRIERTIREKLVKSFPMLSMFLSDDMVEKVTKLFQDELRDFIRDSADRIAKKVEKDLDVKEMVRGKVEAFSSDKLEALLTSLMKKEFRFIELIGAIIGFFIGCIQVALTLAGT